MLTPPVLRLGSRWIDANTRPEGFTDNLYGQIPQENFNGDRGRSVEGGSPSGEEDGATTGVCVGRVEGGSPRDELSDKSTRDQENGHPGTRALPRVFFALSVVLAVKTVLLTIRKNKKKPSTSHRILLGQSQQLHIACIVDPVGLVACI
jgi:hypothetical protein